MKRSFVLAGMLIVLFYSNSRSQELSIGPAGGALFAQSSHGYGRSGSGSSFALGGEVVYSMSTIPLDFVAQAFYSPIGGGHYRMHDSLVVAGEHEGHRGNESSLFSMGLGGRWVPLRGQVSPYLGVSVLLSHQEGPHRRADSTQASAEFASDTIGYGGQYDRGGGVTRFGVGVSVGSEFVFSSLIRLDVGASYSFNTPFDRGRNLSTIGFGASVLFTLF